jgi:hypothetical protein
MHNSNFIQMNTKKFLNQTININSNVININENQKGKISAVNNKLELNYGLIQFALFNLFFSLMIVSLIITILKSPGEIENKYVNNKF